MRRLAVLAALVGLLTAAPATAQQTEAQRRAAQEIYPELMSCSVYFSLIGACMGTRPDLPDARATQIQYDQFARDFRELSLRIGVSIGVTQDALLSRYKMTFEDMVDLTERQPCVNISSLRARWERRCVEYARDPEGAMGRHLRAAPGSR